MNGYAISAAGFGILIGLHAGFLAGLGAGLLTLGACCAVTNWMRLL